MATVIGIFVFMMLSFFGIILIGVIFGGDSETVEVENNSVIELNLSDISDDYAGKYSDPWVTAFSERKKIGLTDVINAIEIAETDDAIKGISILNTNSSLVHCFSTLKYKW